MTLKGKFLHIEFVSEHRRCFLFGCFPEDVTIFSRVTCGYLPVCVGATHGPK